MRARRGSVPISAIPVPGGAPEALSACVLPLATRARGALSVEPCESTPVSRAVLLCAARAGTDRAPVWAGTGQEGEAMDRGGGVRVALYTGQ